MKGFFVFRTPEGFGWYLKTATFLIPLVFHSAALSLNNILSIIKKRISIQ